MNYWNGSPMLLKGLATVLVIGFTLAAVVTAKAEPTIISIVPANFATGVSPSASVVFTFSESMDPDLTSAQFIDATPTFYATTTAWSAGNTVLTCTPITPFAAGKQIMWFVSGENTIGDPLSGDPGGFFTTGSGGGGGTGSGTNAITTFNLGKTHNYNQNSTAAPVLDGDFPYLFTASVALASNRTANSISLMLPTAAVSNLMQYFPGNYNLTYFSTNLSSFDTTFPAGSYQFLVQAAASNQQVSVTLSAPTSQPVAPHIANYAAAQAVNASQNFTLTWDAFTGGTAADYIYVTVGNNVFATASPGTSGALAGTATSVVIPAGTLQPGSNYTASVGFYRASWTTNASYVAGTFRGTATEFSLITTGGTVVQPILTNVSLNAGKFSFDVLSASSLAFTVECTTNLAPANWQTLLTTNMTSGTLRLTDPRPTGSKTLFYRVRVN